MKDFQKLPRMFCVSTLGLEQDIAFSDAQNHYLRNVLRQQPGDNVRLFNGRDGEFLAEITALDKKSGQVRLLQQIKAQPAETGRVHLIFAPIKKDRMDFLIEKAVELGVTDLHPVLTRRGEVRKINLERVNAQMIEAAEQCERLDIPLLHDLKPLMDLIAFWDKTRPVLWCRERGDTVPLPRDLRKSGNPAFLIGPEGGFDPEESSFLENIPYVKPVSLGERILRAETACLVCLSHVQ